MASKSVLLVGLLLVLAVAAVLGFGIARSRKPAEIRIGGIFDLTGATHEIAVPYAEGIRAHIAYVNEQGGIDGVPLKLIDFDYGYEVPRAKAVYEDLVNKHNVCMIFGWGTGDTEVLRDRIAKDRIPFTSASYSEILADPEQAPYNFITGVTYSDQVRIALRFIKQQWRDASRPPRVLFFRNDTPFGKSPIEAGRTYAARHGIEIVGEEVVGLQAREAREQILRAKQAAPDYCIIQETTWAASVILRDAHREELKAQFIGTVWTADEKLIALVGEAAEGYMGTMPYAFTDPHLPGIKEALAFGKRNRMDLERGGSLVRFLQGWATADIMLEGLRRADGSIAGPAIRRGLESIQNYDTGGITDKVTLSAENHRACNTLRIGQVRNGRWIMISEPLAAE